MNWDQIQGQWKVMKGKAREQWGKLTEDDVEEAAGDRERLEGKIQARYGSSKEEARREVDEWMGRQ
jgi:uncharacterized protein YjbJ (UPF0337 family)